jgi:hypothetical protein
MEGLSHGKPFHYFASVIHRGPGEEEGQQLPHKIFSMCHRPGDARDRMGASGNTVPAMRWNNTRFFVASILESRYRPIVDLSLPFLWENACSGKRDMCNYFFMKILLSGRGPAKQQNQEFPRRMLPQQRLPNHAICNKLL